MATFDRDDDNFYPVVKPLISPQWSVCHIGHITAVMKRSFPSSSVLRSFPSSGGIRKWKRQNSFPVVGLNAWWHACRVGKRMNQDTVMYCELMRDRE